MKIYKKPEACPHAMRVHVHYANEEENHMNALAQFMVSYADETMKRDRRGIPLPPPLPFTLPPISGKEFEFI